MRSASKVGSELGGTFWVDLGSYIGLLLPSLQYTLAIGTPISLLVVAMSYLFRARIPQGEDFRYFKSLSFSSFLTNL